MKRDYKKVIKKRATVEMAYAKGEAIEIRLRGTLNWQPVGEKTKPAFNWSMFDYRVRPENEYVPFTYEDRDAFRGKWITPKAKKYHTEMCINNITKRGIACNGCKSLTFKEAFDFYEFIDGSVFGKKLDPETVVDN